MFAMANRRPPAQLPPPSELKLPLDEAKAALAEQIVEGKMLRGTGEEPEVDLDELRQNVSQWRDYNRTWLDRYVGGELAREYHDTSTHYGFGAKLSASQEFNFIRRELLSEVGKLESISNRLDLVSTESGEGRATVKSAGSSGDVFIVHGSDEGKAALVARVIDNSTDRKAVILHEQPNGGRTLIEKFEHNAGAAGYAVVILTADDEGAMKGRAASPRARQNVVFEMGFFFGLIGRQRACVLYEPGVEKPSDIEGIVYVEWDVAGAWKTKLLSELAHAGITR